MLLRFLKFMKVGAVTAAIDFSLFWVLVGFANANVHSANAISFSAALFVNYFGHIVYTFNKTTTIKSFNKFFLVVVFNYIIQSGILYLGTFLGFEPIFSKMIAIMFITANGYLLMSKWVVK